jgi:hypothetical protein
MPRATPIRVDLEQPATQVSKAADTDIMETCNRCNVAVSPEFIAYPNR